MMGRNFKRYMCVMVLTLMLGLIGCSHNPKVELKKNVFDVEVNDKVTDSATTYFKDLKEGTVEFIKPVDTSKIGKVKATIKYDDVEYEVTFNVVDKTSPILKVSQKEFKFDVGTSKDKVNETINKKIKVTDNFDKKFEPITIIDKKYDKAQKVKKKLSVKDSSGNISNEVEITINFVKKVSPTSVSKGDRSSNKKVTSSNDVSNNSYNKSDKIASNNTQSTDKKNTNSNTNKQNTNSGGNSNKQNKPTTNKPSAQEQNRKQCEQNGGKFSNNTCKYSYSDTSKENNKVCYHEKRGYLYGRGFNTADELDDYMYSLKGFSGTWGAYQCPDCGKWFISNISPSK